MRYIWFLVAAWVLSLSTTASAQVCCPSGCVQDGRFCSHIGTHDRSCRPVPCRPGGVSGGGGGSGVPGPPGVPPPSIPGACTLKAFNPDHLHFFTNECVSQLTGTMQFWACTFEDAAGVAEDLRTGLSCRDRIAALAQQCRARCAQYASTQNWCDSIQDSNEKWVAAFGGVGGTTVGFADVNRCGPRLPSRPRARPFNPNVLAPTPAAPFTPSPFIFR
jgi:hypothetical protein